MDIIIREADLENPEDAAAVVAAIDSYANTKNGQDAPISDEARENIARGLADHPSAFVLLGFADGRPAGIAVCLIGYSTFVAKPLVNIHDIAVLPEFRGRGLGSALLRGVADRARELGCCKVTLEVHESNDGARRLYEREGFVSGYGFSVSYSMQKKL